MPLRRRQPSRLLEKTWNVGSVGRLRVVEPTQAQIAAVDAQWPLARRPTDWNSAWRWLDLTTGKTEVFAVVDEDDQVAGIWCSAKHKPIQLPEGLFYRPDYLEIAPRVRGQEIGVFLFLLIVARALELGASGVVLGTWEVLRGFYGGLGGVERKPRGWNLEANLVPFTFDAETLADLKAALDGMEEHGQGTTDL
jgi:GNAT superfamily N-acetyltransferase